MANGIMKMKKIQEVKVLIKARLFKIPLNEPPATHIEIVRITARQEESEVVIRRQFGVAVKLREISDFCTGYFKAQIAEFPVNAGCYVKIGGNGLKFGVRHHITAKKCVVMWFWKVFFDESLFEHKGKE